MIQPTLSRRWCRAIEASSLNVRIAKADLRDGKDVHSDFQTMVAPAEPYDQTRFKIYRKGNKLLVAILAIDCRSASAGGSTLEIHFDPFHDRVGRVQFVFAPDDTVSRHMYLPYTAFHSSGYQTPSLVRWRSWDEPLGKKPAQQRIRLRWVMAWFDTAQVVANGVGCGFNVCRHRADLQEHSAWQYPAGQGLQDPQDYGDLWLKPPAKQIEGVVSEERGKMLVMRVPKGGRLLQGRRGELIDPLGQRQPVAWTRQEADAEAKVGLMPRLAGRYRLEVDGKRRVAGNEWQFDLLPEVGSQKFTVAFTADPPDNMRVNYYTPSRLDEEMAAWSRWGVERMYWIDSGLGDKTKSRSPLVRKSYRACGDLLASMVSASKANGIEPWAVFKTFDLAINDSRSFRGAASGRGGVRDLENGLVSGPGDLLSAQQATMHADDAWQTEPSEPVRTLRFYSQTTIPQINAKQVSLLVSDDNKSYRPYKGKWQVRQGKMSRPHACWTPAGKQQDEGQDKGQQKKQQVNDYIELTGLQLTELYVVVQMNVPEARLSHRVFMLAEALDAQGAEQPLTLANEGNPERGLIFWKLWRTWANRNEPQLENAEWPLGEIGLVLRRPKNAPTLLEPTCPMAQQIWLDRIARQVKAGVAGVDIRTLCHHNAVVSDLGFAFGPTVRERFEAEYNRQPEMTAEDYQRIREIRGRGYTDFLRQASKLVRSHKARLAIHLESGMEIPSHLDTRLQIHWDWRTWIEQKIVDEVTLKWFTAQSHFVHEQVLPLCRANGVAVHVSSRNLDQGPGVRGMEMWPQLIRDARAAGFTGYNFYETANCSMMDPVGRFVPRGNTAAALQAASAAAD